MKIFLGTDHAGFQLKEAVKEYLERAGHEVTDLGANIYDPQDHYPDFIIPAAEAVAETPGSVGIVFGGSGQGEALAANKVPGIRAALYYGGNKEIIRLSRQHNNANVLALGGRMLTETEAKEAVALWLATEFEGGRHEQRLQMIQQYESSE